MWYAVITPTCWACFRISKILSVLQSRIILVSLDSLICLSNGLKNGNILWCRNTTVANQIIRVIHSPLTGYIVRYASALLTVNRYIFPQFENWGPSILLKWNVPLAISTLNFNSCQWFVCIVLTFEVPIFHIDMKCQFSNCENVLVYAYGQQYRSISYNLAS